MSLASRDGIGKNTMCIICVDMQKNKLTHEEARRNLGEIHETLDKAHVLEVIKLIWKKQDEEDEMFREMYCANSD